MKLYYEAGTYPSIYSPILIPLKRLFLSLCLSSAPKTFN